ncbi:MAG: PhzF family phenazine biosynthesis protein [Candidatus Thermoplasmatota archaeon]|jgi:PhzF family phenazine biosynthesis protein|nr:PhzF family phenazine biosynthesis protein [Candidatus Thermoplasmatota archaeon]
MKISIKKVNAFTDSLNGGNPAGVVLNSPELTNKQMIYISKLLNVSETAFVSPSKKADFKLRFFSPELEVDLCGHATIATFFTMALENYFPDKINKIVTQETKAGILPVCIDFTEDGDVDRVMMTQSKPILKDIYLDILSISDTLRISKENIDDSLPKQIVSTGLFTLPICIKSLDILKKIKPDFEKIKKICNELGVGSFHLFTFETIENTSVYHARNFAPIYGVNEDPVTGTANGAVCFYLLKNRIIQENNLLCEQGDIIGRPGRVFVEINKNIVKVGGKAKVVEEKEIKL